MAKPMSLADRIRAQQKANIDSNELEKEKNLIKAVINPQNRASEQQDNRATEQVDIDKILDVSEPKKEKKLIKSISKSLNRAIEQVNNRTSEQQDNRTTEQASEQVSNRTSEQAPEQQDNRASEQVDSLDLSKKPSDLKLNQYKILHYIYFNRPFKVKGLEQVIGVKYGTIRNCINSLVKKGYINKPFSINDGINKGSFCNVNELKCIKLFGPSKSEQVNNRTTEQAPEQVNNRTSEQQSKCLYSSSSSFININKETTTNEIFSNPEMKYWEQKKLKQKQIESWMKELNISLEDIIQSLCHCRFEMVDLGLEESKPINDVFNWFYKRIKKTGFYHSPQGYKSFEEKSLEREQQRLKDIQNRAKELKAIREAQAEAEMDLKFEEMMADPECEIYKKCYGRLNNTQKKLKKTGFETCMRTAFEKMEE